MYSRSPERLVIQQILSTGDSERAFKTLQKLSLHKASRWALVGGLAVEFHCLRGGHAPSIRHLNDIDFVVSSFGDIPESLAREFLFRHVHPFDPPGKTLMQLVDANTSLRVDLFRVYGGIMSRTIPAALPSGPLQVISVEDATARAARLLLDLDAGVPVSAKHAGDYLRLVELVKLSRAEAAWQDHRKPSHPITFRETSTLVEGLIATRRDLLISPEYSRNAAEICPRCVRTPPFPLADANVVLSLLGYC
jgi:hypothetical protein